MNIIFERPTLNRTTDKENIALIDRWIADTVDKLNTDPDMGNSGDVPTKLSDLQDDSTHRTVTDAEKASWNNKPSSTNVYQTNDAEATTISDTDYVPYSNTSGKKRISWSNIKAVLKTYFDTLYAAISHTHTKSQITDFPTLATVATSGSYTDLSNTPTIPSAQVNSDWNSTSGVSQILNKPTLAAVATSGDYDDLVDAPGVEAAASGGTTPSLVTTGDKYRWNNKLGFVHIASRGGVEVSAGGSLRFPASGTSSDLTTSSKVVVFASTVNGKALKYREINVYDGYATVTFAQAISYANNVTVSLYVVK